MSTLRLSPWLLQNPKQPRPLYHRNSTGRLILWQWQKDIYILEGWYNFRLGPWYGIKVGAASERQQRKQDHRVKDGRASIRALTFSEFLVTRHSLSSIKLGRGQIPVLWLAMGMVRSQKAVKEFQLKESFAEGKRFCLLNANDLAVICSDAHWQLVTGGLDANANSIRGQHWFLTTRELPGFSFSALGHFLP